MSNVPDELKFLRSHEWVRLESDGTAYVGISDHAQEAMGDLVYVELPEVGSTVSGGEEAGVVESVKAASDIFSPVTGEVIAINETLNDSPETVNTDPYGDGWLFQVRLSDPSELDSLLSAEDYEGQLEAEEE